MAIRATVLALLLALVGGGATALAMDKTITLTVDGQDRTLPIFAGDVAAALQAAGIVAAPQDRVEPCAAHVDRQRRPRHLQPRPQADPRTRGRRSARSGRPRPPLGQRSPGWRAGPADPDVHLAEHRVSRWPGSRWSSGVPHKVTFTDGRAPRPR